MRWRRLAHRGRSLLLHSQANIAAGLKSGANGYPPPMTTNEQDKNDNSHDHDEPKAGHPGPTDTGKDGGMATRELAPELTED